MAFVPTSPSKPTDLEGWVKKYQGQIDLNNKDLARYKASLAAEKKKSKPNSTKLKFYQSNIDKISKQIGSLKDEIAATQNKIYVRDGKYEKLLSGGERDAYLAISALFKTYNLDTLAGKIYDYVKKGYSADTISILLQDSKEYKERFSGNEARKKAGLPVLSAGEYLSVETSYRQIMQSAGLPSGFYDQPSDFSNWIGKNLSPSEVQSRVDLATQATVLANPNYRKALNQIGISDSQLTAYFLDSSRALPYLQKAAATAAIGGEALSQGLTFDTAYAEQLALKGIGAEEARQGYSTVASELESMSNLGKIYGEEWGQRESEKAVFEGEAGAIQKKGRLLSRERGQFTGGVGGGRAGLAQQGGAR